MLEHSEEAKAFNDLGVCDQLVDACHNLGWKTASKIQAEAIPHALEGKDIIGLAHTGSGKTGAFAIPILQGLLASPKEFFACVISPTRELAIQISQQFEALGAGFGVKCATLVGGLDQGQQSTILHTRPHIIVATPGRLLDHLSNTKDFSLHGLKYLVLDEADKLLNKDFKKALDKILGNIHRERTYLFSATMSEKDYIHRVGRTARAGRSGVAISLVNQYEVHWYWQIEKLIDKKLPEYPPPEEEVLVFLDHVTEAKRISLMKLKEIGVQKKKRW